MKYKAKNYTYCIFFLFIFTFNIYQPTSIKASQKNSIRVLIHKNRNLRIRADKEIPLVFTGTNFFNKKINGFAIKNTKNGLKLTFDKINNNVYNLDNQGRFIVRTSDKRGIWVGRKRYSGKINVHLIKNKIYVVNELNLENYLSSVVGSEMPHKWPIEALKAQAIASRTYVLKEKGNFLYDIDSTQRDQVYNGLESRTNKTIQAVKDSRSLVIIHKNKLINALFHSSSGGMTENSQDVWQNAYPYLQSVRDFDYGNPKLKWKKDFTSKELQKLFPDINGIKNIQILKKTNTGRISKLKIYGNSGSKLIKGNTFRRILKLRSTLFKYKFVAVLNNKNNKNFNDLNNSNITYVSFYGRGAGHGVGMSQWGARNMALRGHKAQRILKHYYKGIEIKPFKNIYK